MTNWGEWKDHCRLATSPYVDWWGVMTNPKASAEPLTVKFVLQMAPQRVDAFDELSGMAPEFVNWGGHSLTFPLPEGVQVPLAHPEGEDCPKPLSIFPVPESSNNPDFAQFWIEKDDDEGWLPAVNSYPMVDEDTLVVGVIDVDIGLGHSRFRTKDGKTRVLASWQQGAKSDKKQTHLPCGSELFEEDINDLLTKHSQNDLTNPLDQDSFNRAAGLVDYSRPEGQLALAKREAHGTHVMGLAAGADPALQGKFSKHVRLLVVNLPSPQAYGEGGALLDNYLIYAMRWIMEMHSRICEHSFPKNKKGDTQKWPPLIMNISFGKQAGAKDERQAFVRELGELAKVDEIVGKIWFNCVLPAGNDNLLHAHARFGLAPTDEQELEWRIKPDDETSNFVEIWIEKIYGPSVDISPLQIDVVPPGGCPGEFVRARDGQISDLENALGRIYCDAVPSIDGKSVRFRYLICLAPDTHQSGPKPGAAAGLWKIRFRNWDVEQIYVRAAIQTDQATLPGLKVARRSYFEDENYQQFEPSGRVADTYAYVTGSRKAEDLDKGSIIKRHGTLNSYAANRYVATIGGYRLSDGRPAPYSASGLGHRQNPDGRGAPTAALQTDDGYAHFGILSDGATDGSVVAMQGTSFSCACATRKILEAWLSGDLKPKEKREDKKNGEDEGRTIKSYLYTCAKNTPPPGSWHRAPVDIENVGAGRIVFQPIRGVKRM